MDMTAAIADTDIAVPEPNHEIAMDVRLLGPLAAWLDGQPFLPSATKPRQLFALLVIRAGELVTTSTMIEELWGRRPPRSANQTIHTYILTLRRHLTDNTPALRDPHDILATRPGGYTLAVPPDIVDANRYQDLAVAGERALVRGEYETASQLLGAALDIWRGPAMVDLPQGVLLGIEVTRLEQSRLSVLESRVEADLRLGRHHQLLGELAELTARYPMHERLCSQYMTALSVCGLKWRALDVFRVLRKTLVRELGMEPSLRVQRLQRAILSSDLAVDGRACADT
jgi:SARP family transcriptional regulator, regulator of embCAB operon